MRASTVGPAIYGLERLIGMPARGQRPRLRFKIADDASDEQIGIIKRSAKSVRQRIAQLAAFAFGKLKTVGCELLVFRAKLAFDFILETVEFENIHRPMSRG